MSNLTSNVTVKQLPAAFDARHERIFLLQLEDCWNASRPRIVLDCANVRQIDHPFVHLLLSCLEEAMKRNGDVRLAGVGPEARALLKRHGVDRLFKIFATNQGAIESYQGRQEYSATPAPSLDNGGQPPAKDAV